MLKICGKLQMQQIYGRLFKFVTFLLLYLIAYSFSGSYASLQPVYEPIHDIRGQQLIK